MESLAIVLLYSFLDARHERRIARAARRRGLTVSASCEIAPEFREYERTSTTVANAFVAPVMRRYIGRLTGQVRRLGVRAAARDAIERGESLRASGGGGAGAYAAVGTGGGG